MGSYSVLMSVYAKEKPEYLRMAMESMWNQTVPTDDFVLVCDGPLTEELNLLIDEMMNVYPYKLKVVYLEKNSGLGIALNEGLKYCRNDIVARMDSDDISLSSRCAKQLALFLEHPNLCICSGTILEFDENENNITGKRKLPRTDKDIRRFSKKRNPFNHPAVMFKKSAVMLAGGYDEKYHLFEDYYLWVRMMKDGVKSYNISEPLLLMRTPKDLYLRRGGYSTPQICSNSTGGCGKQVGQVGWITSLEQFRMLCFVCCQAKSEGWFTRKCTSRLLVRLSEHSQQDAVAM